VGARVARVSAEIVCPECGEDDDLRGERIDELIHITCGSCGRAWDRDPSPRCPICDSDDLHACLKAVVERSRGTQLSVVGTEVVHLCRVCDAGALESYRLSGTLLMPEELPTVGPEQDA